MRSPRRIAMVTAGAAAAYAPAQNRRRGVAWAVAIIATACASAAPSQFGDSAPFGSNDLQCASAVLANEADDRQVLTAAVDCLFAEYESATPVTVDFDVPTVEGDSTYTRYRFDGTSVLIVYDNRADEYGVGGIRSRLCAEIQRTDWLPEGFDCTQVNHPGFPEAG